MMIASQSKLFDEINLCRKNKRILIDRFFSSLVKIEQDFFKLAKIRMLMKLFLTANKA
jgi:hypothetical protein